MKNSRNQIKDAEYKCGKSKLDSLFDKVNSDLCEALKNHLEPNDTEDQTTVATQTAKLTP